MEKGPTRVHQSTTRKSGIATVCGRVTNNQKIAALLATLAETLGPDFTLVESRPYQHATPWNTVQSFQYSLFSRRR